MSNLPKGWELVTLESVTNKMQSGGTPKSTNEDFYNGKIPFVKIEDITSCKKFLTKTKITINEEGLKNSSAWLVPKDSILYSMYASLGFLAINKIPVSTNQAIMNIIPNSEKIDLEYLYQFLLDLKNKIDKFIDQTTQKNLNAQKVKNFLIPLPPLEEQKKIADILSTVDKKIAFVEENINATEELKKGLMQKLLTEGICHTEFKDSELGRIPESWEVVPFIELADKNIKHSFTGGPFGSDLKSEHYTDIGVRVIQLQNIGDGYFINNDFVYVSEEKAESLKSCQIYPNDIILAKMAEPVARACLIPDIESKYIMCSDGIRLKVDNSKFNTEFIFYSINYDNFRKIAVARSTGTTRLRIGLSALKSIPIVIPPLEEQKQIAEILSTVDNKLENLKEKKQSFENLKKGLMQKLLTGEVRV